VIWLGMECSPCRRRPTCGGKFTCLRDITPAMVLNAPGPCWRPGRRMKILHVEAGKHLYGGARQVLYIVEAWRPGHRQPAGLPRRQRDGRQQPAGARGADEDGRRRRHRPGLPPGRLIRAEQADLVHLHSRRGADTWGGLAAKLAGCPACCAAGGQPRVAPRRGLKYRLYDHVITISEGIRQVLLTRAGAGKVSCVRSAVGDAFLAPVDPPPSRRVPPAPGRPGGRRGGPDDPAQGPPLPAAALPGAARRHPELQVLIFGQGRFGELRGDVAARGLDGVVHFTGFRHDLARWIGGLDMLVHPAEMEGLGVSCCRPRRPACR
jgi:hypothetical protein